MGMERHVGSPAGRFALRLALKEGERVRCSSGEEKAARVTDDVSPVPEADVWTVV